MAVDELMIALVALLCEADLGGAVRGIVEALAGSRRSPERRTKHLRSQGFGIIFVAPLDESTGY